MSSVVALIPVMAQPFKLKLYCLGLMLTGLTFEPAVHALPPPESAPQTDTRVFTEASYMKTTANYDVDGGGYIDLGNGRYYQLIDGRLGAEHWLTRDFSLLLETGMAYAESYDGGFVREGTEATDVVAGARYRLGFSGLNLIPEVIYVHPFHRVDRNTDDVLTNEGAMKIFSGLWAEYWASTFKFHVHPGFLYQDGGRAGLGLLTVGVDWIPGGLRFGVEGYSSVVIVHDEREDSRILRDVVTARVNGGSWRFYSVDPSTHGVRASAAFDLGERLRLGFGFDHTLDGEASAAGWTASLRLEMGLNVRENSLTEKMPSPRALDPEKQDIKQFEPTTTPYDSTLFEDPKPKKVKRPTPKRVKKKPPVDLDKSLEDVQKSLER